MIKTTRLGPGLYSTSNGYTLKKVQDSIVDECWHILDSKGNHCQTVSTKRDALKFLESM